MREPGALAGLTRTLSRVRAERLGLFPARGNMSAFEYLHARLAGLSGLFHTCARCARHGGAHMQLYTSRQSPG